MVNVEGGMRLASSQPQAGSMVNGPAVTTDPRRHRLGLVKMKIGTAHSITVDGQHMHLIARDAQTVDLERAKPVIVCLHRACRGKTWKSEEALAKDHPPRAEMLKAGEVHVYGWFSAATMEEDAASAQYAARLLVRGEAFVKQMREFVEKGKDFEEMSAAMAKLEMAEKQVAGLKKLAAEKQAQIVGFVSDEFLEIA